MVQRDPREPRSSEDRMSMRERRAQKRLEEAEHDSHSMATTIFVVVMILIIIGAAIYLTT
ncbi:MAG: hypothetical protein P8H05_01145 [Schleiferiaceae bacterium]|nr:hypothetical protein [Schleiferiaceae bacterium]